jgi:hypothetical protein
VRRVGGLALELQGLDGIEGDDVVGIGGDDVGMSRSRTACIQRSISWRISVSAAVLIGFLRQTRVGHGV